MKKLLLTTLFLLFFCVIGNAQGFSAKMSDYATCGDTDITSELQTAVDAMKTAGGGQLEFDPCVWEIDGQIDLYTNSNFISYKFWGGYGAIIKVQLSTTETLLRTYNTNLFHLDGLVFIGDTPTGAGYDAKTLLQVSDTHYAKITNCQFYGMRFADVMINAGIYTDLIIEGSIFGGNAVPVAFISTFNSNGLIVDNSRFIDFGNFDGVFYTKAPVSAGEWILVDSNNLQPTYDSSPNISITNSRFDEGSFPACIHLKNSPSAYISGVNLNISATSNSSGILLDNVGFAKILFSSFGLVASPRPAIKLINSSIANADGLTFYNSIYLGLKDNLSKISLWNGNAFVWKTSDACASYKIVKCI